MIQDEFPEKLEVGQLIILNNLQTELELLAEHQATYMATDAFYGTKEIAEILRNKFGEHLKLR